MIALATLLLLAAAPAAGSDDDAVKRALGDELARSQRELAIKGEPKPYFIAYTVIDILEGEASASFGALTLAQQRTRRIVRVDLRVGDAKFDNTNFSARYSTPEYSATEVALGDDYRNLRRALWRRSDDAYRAALERLAAKKAAAERQAESADNPPDFTSATPLTLTHAPPHSLVAVDPAALGALVVPLSRVFRGHADIQRSNAWALHTVVRRRYLSSEGSFVDERHSAVRVDVRAETQAPDGMPLGNAAYFRALEPGQLPTLPVMQAEVERRAGELVAARRAPIASPGDALVIYEGPAATDMIWRLLADRVSGTPPARTPGGEERREGSLAERLGQRVGPKFFTVFDDPSLAAASDGTPLFGNYRVDDEGIAGTRVKLIEKGVLTGLFMSRTPSRDFAASNGHGRGHGYNGTYQARFANLVVDGGRAALTPAALRAKALAVAKDDGPRTNVYVVRLLDDDPMIAFRLVRKSDKVIEEPVRGLVIEGMSPRRLKDLVALGDTPYVANVVQVGGGTGPRGLPSSIVSPPLLFKDLEVRRETRKFPKPPLYPHPSFVNTNPKP